MFLEGKEPGANRKDGGEWGEQDVACMGLDRGVSGQQIPEFVSC